MGATTSEGTGPGSAEGPLRGFDLDKAYKILQTNCTQSSIDVVKETDKVDKYTSSVDAENVGYNDSTTSLGASTVQEAIEALDMGAGGTTVENDTDPKLGGNLDTNGFCIVTADDNDLVFEPDGDGAIRLNCGTTGTVAVGDARGNNAVDLQTTRVSSSQVASGLRAFIAGGSANTASASSSFACGSACTASDNNAFACNSTTTASMNNAFACGSGTTASGNQGFACGSNTTASGQNCVAMGSGTTAGGQESLAMGMESITINRAALAHSGGMFDTIGDAQYQRLVMVAQTTTAESVLMLVDQLGSAATTLSNFNVEDETAYMVTIDIIARRDTGAEHAYFSRRCLIERTGGTTALVGSVETLGTDNNTPVWTVPTIAANDTNDVLTIQVTGESAENIRWVASVKSVAVGYSD